MSERTKRHGVRPRERQKYWRQADARTVLDAWRSSGLRLSEFARQQGLSPKRLERCAVGWRPRDWSRGRRRFTPCSCSACRRPAATDRSAGVIEIVLGDGYAVRVPQGFAAADLSRVLDVLQARAAC